MKKRILLVDGNPKKHSLSGELANQYRLAAKEKHDIRYHQLSKMEFDPNLYAGFDIVQSLEADLTAFQESVRWADHIVIFTPVWWGSLPAKLKGVIDRTFLPGFAFKYLKGKSIPEKLLKNKSARIVMTMDTPPWYYKYIQGAPALKQLKVATLEFSGYKNVRHTMVGPVIGSTEASQTRWKQQARALGANGQ